MRVECPARPRGIAAPRRCTLTAHGGGAADAATGFIPRPDMLPASDTLPQSLCYDAHLGLDRSGGVQADVFSVARPNKLHAHGVTGHEGVQLIGSRYREDVCLDAAATI